MNTASTLEQAWLALRRHLDARAADLCAAVRCYPGPIARCDDQLPLFIAERDEAVRIAARAAEADDPAACGEFSREERIACFAATLEPRDDMPARTLQRALLDALKVAA
jgi:hypothetical protein